MTYDFYCYYECCEFEAIFDIFSYLYVYIIKQLIIKNIYKFFLKSCHPAMRYPAITLLEPTAIWDERVYFTRTMGGSLSYIVDVDF